MYEQGLKSWVKHLDFMVLDTIITIVALAIAYSFKVPGVFIYSLSKYKTTIPMLIAAVITGSLILHAHRGILRRGYLVELISVIKLVAFVVGFVLVCLFIFKIRWSRMVVISFVPVDVLLMYAERLVWRRIIKRYRRSSDSHIRHMFVITVSDEAEKLLDIIRENSVGEFSVIGMAFDDCEADLPSEIRGISDIMQTKEVIDFISKQWVDELMVYLPSDRKVPDDILRKCAEMGITTHIALELDNDRYTMKTVEKVAGIPTITESIKIVDSQMLVVKRVMDIAGAVVGLLFTAILTVIFAPMIFISDPGPVFFSQERVGRNGRVFKIYKFRSMYMDAEKRKAELMDRNEMKGHLFKMENDPRIIGSGPDGKKHGIGWFIRKTSIDEFPQFFNVLKGEMSLVGTRPPTVDEWENYDLEHRARLAIKPGLTGMWQVSGRNDIKDFDRILAMDMQYINSWSIAEDIKIIFKTVGSVLSGKGAE